MKICFVGNLSTTFIKRDYEILNKHFDVDVIEPPKKKSGWFKYLFTVKNKIKKCDVAFGWFAGWHTAFSVHYSKKYKRRSIVVVGGYDAAYIPEINYGAFTNLKERIPARYVLKHADLILPVSEFTKKEVLKRVKPKQVKLLYNGVNINKFKSNKTKENFVITIGNKIRLKGLDTFADASKNFPNHKFVIIGDNKTNTEILSNPNIIFTGKIPHDEVLKWLQKAKVYCQLSYTESFGMGLAEAMACECVPVVTDRGAIHEVVGDAGFYVPYGNEKATTEAIKKALNASDKLGKMAREQIESFSLRKRETRLVEIVKMVDSITSAVDIRLKKSIKIANIKDKEKVLDLGCGNKILKYYLSDGIEYTGIDKIDGIDLEKELPSSILSQKFDVIFMNEFIEHIENFKSLLMKCREILSDNGRIIISTPSANRIIYGDIFNGIGEDKTHICCFKKSNMRNLVRICGFKITKIIGTYIRFPPLLPNKFIAIPTNQTIYSEVIIYRLEH